MSGRNLKLIFSTLPNPRNKEFPDTRGSKTAHRVVAPVPVIKIADNGNPLRTRSPNCKRDTSNTIKLSQMSAHFVVCLMIIALVKEIKIILGQSWQETIRIVELTNLTIVTLNPQAIGKHRLATGNETFKKAVLGQALQ